VKSVAFGLILAVVMALLLCMLDSDSGQLKDMEFRIVLPLLGCLAVLLCGSVVSGPTKPDDWEPN